MQNLSIKELILEHGDSENPYHEFLRVPAVSAGLYMLKAGATDEDELYYTVEGRAFLTVGEEVTLFGPGSLVFVKAYEEHRFHTTSEDLSVLVFFAPAEYSTR